MSNAFNLSQLANNVNSSGLLSASAGVTGTLPIANGGTGLSTIGANNTVLTSNGTTASWASAGSGGLGGTTVYATSGSFTFTIPTGKTVVKISVVGGGGSAGRSSFNAPPGGSGGGMAVKHLTGLTPGNTLAVTVGAGGAGIAAGGSTDVVGSTGGTSSVASGTQTITTVSATGGAGSLAGPFNTMQPGAPGTGTNGDLNITGQRAGYFTKQSFGCGDELIQGTAGASPFSVQNQSLTAIGNFPASVAGQYGSGSTATQPGNTLNVAAGGAGVVIFEY